MGSEMCIRDSVDPAGYTAVRVVALHRGQIGADRPVMPVQHVAWICLLYTSDAADERSSVDLGGRRIIKKKNQIDLQDSIDD